MPSNDNRFVKDQFVIRRIANPTKMEKYFSMHVKNGNYTFLAFFLVVYKIIFEDHKRFFTSSREMANMKELLTCFWIHHKTSFTKRDMLLFPNGYELVATNKFLRRLMDYGWIELIHKHRGGDSPQPNVYRRTTKMSYDFDKYYRWCAYVTKITRNRLTLGDLLDDEKFMQGVLDQNRTVDDFKAKHKVFKADKI